MKIGISCYPTYGGSGVVATELGKNLARLGHEVHFISYAVPQRLTEYYENVFYHEVKVPEYPLFEYPPYALALATKIADIAAFEKLEIIHVHYAIPHAISAYLAREMMPSRCDFKIITTLHGTDITLVGADPSFMRITQFGLNKSDAVTAVSHYLKEETVKIFRPDIPVRVIHNFIETHPQQKKICNHLRKRLAPENEPILMHLSNFRPIKRVQDVIEVARRVLQRMPVRLVMIGDGPERPFAEKQARDYGIADKVIFLGKQENIYLFLSIADVFIMPSQSESFGLAALEAMSCGVPCVTSDAGGLTEVNKNGVSGFVVPVGDIDSLSQRVLHLLENPAFREKMSAEARNYAFENFHADIVIPQYLELYQELLEG